MQGVKGTRVTSLHSHFIAILSLWDYCLSADHKQQKVNVLDTRTKYVSTLTQVPGFFHHMEAFQKMSDFSVEKLPHFLR